MLACVFLVFFGVEKLFIKDFLFVCFSKIRPSRYSSDRLNRGQTNDEDLDEFSDSISKFQTDNNLCLLHTMHFDHTDLVGCTAWVF